tara:strand:+ start:16108 stop:16353 length:246 start_codon:yes stop_codon:yes gene_type:complete
MSKQPSNGDLGADALKDFLAQFGEPDIYTRILLEVIFEELFYDSYEEIETDGKTVYLPPQEEQDGCQDGSCSTGTEDSITD